MRPAPCQEPHGGLHWSSSGFDPMTRPTQLTLVPLGPVSDHRRGRLGTYITLSSFLCLARAAQHPVDRIAARSVRGLPALEILWSERGAARPV